MRSLAAVLAELDIGVALVRHIPVVDNGAVVGVVSARDVLPVLTSFARSTI